jgi:hypothetical protein
LITPQEASRIIGKLREAATEMDSPDPVISVGELQKARAAIVDHPASEFAPYVSDRWLAALYLTRKFLGDVWVNLGTDATFAIEDVETYLHDLARSLSDFLRFALIQGDSRDPDLFSLTSRVVRSYARIINAAEGSADPPGSVILS